MPTDPKGDCEETGGEESVECKDLGVERAEQEGACDSKPKACGEGRNAAPSNGERRKGSRRNGAGVKDSARQMHPPGQRMAWNAREEVPDKCEQRISGRMTDAP